jgi:hypothetical protein
MTNSIQAQATHTKAAISSDSIKTQAGSSKPDIRKSMVIIVNPQIKMFHFTHNALAGISNEAWYPYANDKLFEYVEQYLVIAGVANNVTSLDKVMECGLTIDYRVTYNAAAFD